MRKTKQFSYLQVFRPYVWRIILAFLLSSIATVGSFATTHLLSQIVDKLPTIKFEAQPVVFLIILWFTVECIGKFANHISSRCILQIKENIVQKLRRVLAKILERSSSASVQKNTATSLVESANEEAKNFVDSVFNIYLEIFTLILGIGAIVYTSIYSWQILLLLIISLCLILLLQYFMVKKMIKTQVAARNASINTKALYLEILEAFPDMKMQKLDKGLKRLLSNYFDEEAKASVKSKKVILDNTLTSELVSIASQTSFLLLSGYLILTSKLTFTAFVALFMYKGYVYSLVGCITRIVKFFSQASTATKKMSSIIKQQIVSPEHWGNIILKNPSGKISFQDLTVYYGNKCIINGLSVEIPPNSFVGIVGISGGGKSTLCNTLIKENPEYSGSIKIDDVELKDLSESSLRKAITMAPQSPFLFNLTIRQNLTLAHPEASDDEIWDCLKQCAAEEFVKEKGGLDAFLSPAALSGGQKQRLALARLAISGGKIILLDESTSALDGESQEMVIETIRKAADNGHTMVLVAHRVSTLKEADLILLMEDGKISAQGTYDELYKNSEKFRKLADLG